MKTTKKILLTAIVMVLSISTMHAQKYEWELPPKSGEKVIGTFTTDISAGSLFTMKDGHPGTFTNGKRVADHRETKTKEQCYYESLQHARYEYKQKYPNFELRNFLVTCEDRTPVDAGDGEQTRAERHYNVVATVVVKDEPKTTRQNNNDEEEDDLSKALNKALLDVREGSRIAIDQIRVIDGMDRQEYKDNVVERLLDKGFKVVAKEYLEKLYEEQKGQQSGIYNERTTVKSNNFSAVGYFLNVRLTKTTLRVQVVNVSTGEYESNVTIKL